jgi:hypothetical protein
MSVDVKTDTLRLDWRRRDGVWERCGSEWAGSVTPVDLIGPPAAIRKPGPEPLVRSPGASWDRVRALADSVGRAGPELVDARATSAAASAADVDLSGAWATGSTSEPAVSRVVVQLECNYTPSFWIIEQRGDSVRAFTNPESRAQGIRAPDRVQPVTAEGRMVGSLITMSAPGSRYLLRYDPASGHLRGTLNDRPFWAVRQENVRPSGCIPVP